MFAWRVSMLVGMLLLAAIGPVGGTTLLNVSGTFAPSPLTVGCSSQYLAASWTFTNTFTDVSILVALVTGNSPTPTAYLTTHIGPDASSTDVVAGPVALPALANGLVTVFSGLILNANTYYLVLGDPGCGGGWYFIAPNPPTVTTAAGVTHHIDARAVGGDLNPEAPPYASTFMAWNTDNPFVYQLTGNDADTTPPDTVVSEGPTSPTNATTATFIFSGSDDVTPAVSLSFACELDNGGFSSCTSPVTYSSLSSGAHTFAVRATDTAGNTDPTPAPFSWSIDTAAPDTMIDSHPTDPTNSTTATFTFHASEASSTFECSLSSLNGGAFTPCPSPVQYTGLTDGSHTFQVRASDQAHNPDPTPASFTWTVDAQAPDTMIDSHPTDPTNSNTATFTFHGDVGGGETFQCQLDSQAPTACDSGTVTYPGLGAGPHTFMVTATDAVGNTDPSAASFTWTIDVMPPDTSITSVEISSPTATSATFAFAGNDNLPDVLTFECRVDTASFTTCTSPASYSGLSRTSHTFQVRAKDLAGNTDATPASHTWTIAKITQTITFSPLPNVQRSQSPITVSSYATASSGLPVTFTTSTPAVCTAGGPNGATITLLAGGTCTVFAHQPGDSTYLPAADVAQSFTVGSGKLNQTITVTQGAPATAAYRASFTVAATASSGLPVAIGTSGACSNKGGTVTIMRRTGTCTVTFTQAGNATYAPAPQVMQTTTVQ